MGPKKKLMGILKEEQTKKVSIPLFLSPSLSLSLSFQSWMKDQSYMHIALTFDPVWWF